jgi:Zn-dependent metalloprotease
MLRAHGLVGAGAAASLVMAGLTSTAPVQAAPAVHPVRSDKGLHRADPGFGSSQRAAAKREAASRVGKTAASLRLGRSESLVVRDVERDVDGVEHVHYDRTYQGLPVIGGDLIVHQSPSGAVRTVSWSSTHNVQVRGGLGATVTPSAARGTGDRQVIYAVRHAPVLAWEGHVQGVDDDGTPVDDLVYTDAKTGKRLGTRHRVMADTGTGRTLYSGSVPINVTKVSGKWTLTDAVNGNHKTYSKAHSTTGTRGTLVASTDKIFGNGSTTDGQSAAADAHYGAAQTWNFYKNTFGRLGIRGNGVGAYSRVHFGTRYENAFWSDACFCMTYGDGYRTFRQLVELDVAGHEMSHGVTSNTAGLDYFGDSGGLNEATSDVMGTMVEFYAKNTKDAPDYLIGEKVYKGTRGYLRRLDNPHADGHSYNCYPGLGAFESDAASDDPHYTSGVGNHLFYLLAEGSGSKVIGTKSYNSTTCNSTTVAGIGRDKAAAVWYRALTTYWTSFTTYPEAAEGMIRAARDLYGADSTDCARTEAAWKAVKVTPGVTCAGLPSPGSNFADPGFEEPDSDAWSASSGVITDTTDGPAHGGTFYAFLDGYAASHTDTVAQSVAVPSANSATLTFWLAVATEDAGGAFDKLTLTVEDNTGSHVLARYSNLDDSAGDYSKKSLDLTPYVGKTVVVRATGVEDSSLATAFFLDDFNLTTS